ncbi:MAG: TonB C-terminal domain-containing protein [Pseudomonadota bacterium]|nr:TonB C-terminal domain-containing protein [Pseudomonadota bacterium]
MPARTPTTMPRWQILILVALSLLLHVALAPLALPLMGNFDLSAYEEPISVQMIDGDPLDAMTPDQVARLEALEQQVLDEAEEEPEEEEEPEPVMPDGQVVETVTPNEEKVPLVSDYLAEHDNAVKEETRTDAYRVNPEVLSNQYSRDSKLEFEDVVDVGAKDKSTGATVGSLNDPAPGKGAPRSIIPSPWALTNKEGLAAPTTSSSSTQSLSGAPQNDLLNEKLDRSVALNTREFLGAAYINRIRRQVNFYWKQNLDNMSPSLGLSKPNYTTEVAIVLNGDGALESISITHESGSGPLDNGVVEAFRVAGPFPNPPEQLVKRDGRVYLSDLNFTVTLGQAQMQYQGIDPRAEVQFPGILKSPR